MILKSNWRRQSENQRRMNMPKLRSMIDYRRCDPSLCERGICRAVLACPNHVLRQEAPFEMPDPYPSMCVGCAVCAQACPMGAVRVE